MEDTLASHKKKEIASHKKNYSITSNNSLPSSCILLGFTSYAPPSYSLYDILHENTEIEWN